MTYLIASLPRRNLHEVFGQRVPARCQAVILELFDPDCLFSGPGGRHFGHGAGDPALHARLPHHRSGERGPPMVLEDAGLLPWAFSTPAGPITGNDVIVLRQRRIGEIYAFLDVREKPQAG